MSLEAHTGRYIAREEKAKVFREAAAVLDDLHPAEFDGVNCRLFRAAACSGHHSLSTGPPLIINAPKELFCYRTYDELLSQVRQLLSEGRSERKGGSSLTAAHYEHSYDVRLRAILEDVVA